MKITHTLIVINPVNEKNNNTHFFSWLKSNYDSDKQNCIHKYMKQYNTSIELIEVFNRLNEIYNDYQYIIMKTPEQKNQQIINNIFNNRDISYKVLVFNNGDKQFKENDFYQWLLSGNYTNNRMDSKLNYLISEFDFIIGFNTIDEKTLNLLTYIYEFYYDNIERYKLKNINNLNELIIIKDRFDNVKECHRASKTIQVNNESRFIPGYIMSSPNCHLFTFEITDKLKDCLNESFSKHLNLSGYLKLNVRSDNTLVLTYQYDQIIGSIYIAQIENNIPEFLLKESD